MLIYLLVNFLVNYCFFALVLFVNGLVDVLIFLLVDVLRDFLFNSFYLLFAHLFNAKNHLFQSNEQRTGIFFKGLFGPRSIPSPLII